MNVFISGGCKNGKSSLAQDLAVALSKDSPRYYVATMIPFDDEDRERIKKHIQNREGMGFTTVEQGRDVSACLEKADPRATFLVDSVTALLLNELFPDFSAPPDPEGEKRCIEGLLKLAAGAENAVFVSDFIYSDADKYGEFTELYRSALARIDGALARYCDTVIEMCAGTPVYHKGGPIK